MVTSLSLPQQTEQIVSPLAGQSLRGLRFSQMGQAKVVLRFSAPRGEPTGQPGEFPSSRKVHYATFRIALREWPWAFEAGG